MTTATKVKIRCLLKAVRDSIIFLGCATLLIYVGFAVYHFAMSLIDKYGAIAVSGTAILTVATLWVGVCQYIDYLEKDKKEKEELVKILKQ